ncbi:hypothetical protein [Clostridium taeniosporum]|uniref:Uncharacterized protein n=1 Tax=Clostridium taeniosporum TaxID=394958 RepID=A0A1D7XHA9_9CLOT|nr:hypothetical protein [Clostridium taeniosporum]AOR22490.1 hypothetical protein BGI42_01540 [Clostridium taeniosporum]
MIIIKLEKNRRNKIIFKAKFTDGEEKKIFFKRAIIEGKKLKGEFEYQIPLRFFIPIVKNINKKEVLLDKDSLFCYLEFSDIYDQNYYNETQATPNYMKKWREEGCPEIYKVTIDKESYDIEKEIIFKKPHICIK